MQVAHCPGPEHEARPSRFDYAAAKAHGVNVALGTDGRSSNNNLDTVEEAKVASLLAKARPRT
ncbi:hypothetical protein MASR1M66_21290 [Aminivibrio sp.]